MRKFLALFLAIVSFALVADTSSDNIECVGMGTSEIVCWTVGEDINPPSVSTNIVMTKDHCEQIKRTVTESYNAVGSLIGFVSQSASHIFDDADRTESRLGTYYNDIVLIHDSLEQDLQVNPNPTVSNNVDRLESLASNIYDLQPNFMAIKGEANMIQERASTISNILDNVLSTVSRVKCVDGEECSSSGDGSVQCPCVEQFNSVVDAVERVRSELVSLHADANAAWAHLVQLEMLVSNVCESAEYIRNRLLAPDDRMWNDVLSLITNMVYVSSNNIADIEHRSLDISSLLQDIQRAVRGDLSNENNIQLSNEGVIALYNLIGNFSTYSLLASGLSEFRHQFGMFSNTVYTLFQQFNQTIRGRFAGNNLGYQLSQLRSRDYLYRVATNDTINADSRYTFLVANSQGGLTNWFGRMEYYLQSLLGWYNGNLEDNELTALEPEKEGADEIVKRHIHEATNRLELAGTDLNSVSNAFHSMAADFLSAFGSAPRSANIPSYIQIFPSVEIFGTSFGPFGFETSDISEYLESARDVSTLIWDTVFWLFLAFLAYLICRISLKSLFLLLKFLKDL